MRTLLLLIVVVTLCTLCESAVLWVSPGGTSTGPCARLAPCPLPSALAILGDGDVARLLPGVHEQGIVSSVTNAQIIADEPNRRCDYVIECTPQLTSIGIKLSSSNVSVSGLSVRGCSVGIDVSGSHEVTLNDVSVFRNVNVGVRVTSSNVFISDSFFTLNSGLSGSAVTALQQSHVNVTRSVMTLNSASSKGGAMRVDSTSSFSLSECQLDDNQSRFGGALVVEGMSSDSHIRDCSFANNTASEGSGGAIHVSGSATNALHVHSSVFVGNEAQTCGGGVYAANALVRGEDVLLHSNRAQSCGGGVRAVSSEVHLTDVSFVLNSALDSDSSGSGGGALSSSESLIHITDSTYNRNSAICGADVHCESQSQHNITTSTAIAYECAVGSGCSATINSVENTCDGICGDPSSNGPEPVSPVTLILPNSTVCSQSGTDIRSTPLLSSTSPPTTSPTRALTPQCLLSAPCTCAQDQGVTTCTYASSVVVNGNADLSDQHVHVIGNLVLRSTSRISVNAPADTSDAPIRVDGTIVAAGSLVIESESEQTFDDNRRSFRIFTHSRFDGNFTEVEVDGDYETFDCNSYVASVSSTLSETTVSVIVNEREGVGSVCSGDNVKRNTILIAIGALIAVVVIVIVIYIIIRARMRSVLRHRVRAVVAAGGGVSDDLLRKLNMTSSAHVGVRLGDDVSAAEDGDFFLPEGDRQRSSVILDDMTYAQVVHQLDSDSDDELFGSEELHPL